jgi:hypothetical protein
MALSQKRLPKSALKGLDNADIVREAISRQQLPLETGTQAF